MLQHVAVDKAGVGFGGIKVIRVLTLRVGWKIHALCTLGCVRYVAEQIDSLYIPNLSIEKVTIKNKFHILFIPFISVFIFHQLYSCFLKISLLFYRFKGYYIFVFANMQQVKND